jgi:hypothetical protein
MNFEELCQTLKLSNDIISSASAMIEEMYKCGSEEIKVRLNLRFFHMIIENGKI